MATTSAIVDGAALADRIAVSEMWLDGDTLCATLDGGVVVRVTAVLANDGATRHLDHVEVTCSDCGTDVCRHTVAAVLCAHGAAGAASRLVQKG